METRGSRFFPGKSVVLGAAIGFAFGLFVAVPWGAFASAEAPGIWLAVPLVLAFTLVGGWFGTATSLASIEQSAGDGAWVEPRKRASASGPHHHPTAA